MLGYLGKVGRMFTSGGAASKPSLDLSFMGGALDSRFTFSRASVATDGLYTDTAGSSYNSFASGAPRLSATRGLLFEQGTTNRLLNSDTPATQTTASIAASACTLWVVGTGSATVSAGTATITGAGTATAGSPNVFTITVAGTVTVTVTGSLTRFQLESNSFPTSYMPTLGSIVTRAADLLTMPLGSWFNASAGTLWTEAMLPFLINSNIVMIEPNDGTINNRISLQLNNVPADFSAIATAGSSTTNSNTNTLPIGTVFRGACSYSAAGHTVAAAGISHARIALPGGGLPVVNTFQIGQHGNNTGYFNGFIRRTRFYPREMLAAELASVTV